MRDSFILHVQQLRALFSVLTDEQMGRLLRVVVAYQSGDEPAVDADILTAWAMLKMQLNYDADKYDKKCAQLRANIAKRWQKTKEYKCIQLNTNDTNRYLNDNDNDNDNDIVNNDNKGVVGGLPDIPATLDTRKRFVKPSIEDIAAYCNERKNGINAAEFFDHYEANGWKRGKTPIKDWRACVRTWEAKHKNERQASVIPDINEFRDGNNY